MLNNDLCNSEIQTKIQ